MALEISADIPAHDEDLVGDQLSTLVINFRWRRILTPLLLRLCSDSFWTGTEAEIEDAVYKAVDLIKDLYTFEPLGGGDINYLGALVTRTTLFTAPVAGVLVPFEFNSGSRAHDVGGFWNIASPWFLEVPVGGAGYYNCFTYGFVDAAASSIMLRIHRGASGVLTWTYTTDTNFALIRANVIAFFADGDRISVEARTTFAARDFIPTSFDPMSLTLGMYKVGDAP